MSALYTDEYTRFMVELFDQVKKLRIPTGGQSFFGDPSNGGITSFDEDAATVEIDILKANGERLAAMVHRGQSSHDVNKNNIIGENYTNIIREYPLIEETASINSAKLLLRQPGENPFSGRTRRQRNQDKALRYNFDMIQKIGRLYEYLCWQSLLNGEHPAIYGTTNSDLIYDFYRLATHIITVTNAWNSGSQDIMGDIDAACYLIEADGLGEANYMLLGEDAQGDFINDTNVQALADNRRFELIEVSTNNPVPNEYSKLINNGFIARGRLRTPGGRNLWIFNYNKNYTIPGGSTKTRFLPKDQALIGDISARFDRHFGPPDRLPVTMEERAMYQDYFGFNMDSPPMPPETNTGNVLPMASMFFDAYRSEDKKTIRMRAQAAPIFPTTETDLLVTLKGLHT